jgi:hypothetical protein
MNEGFFPNIVVLEKNNNWPEPKITYSAKLKLMNVSKAMSVQQGNAIISYG